MTAQEILAAVTAAQSARDRALYDLDQARGQLDVRLASSGQFVGDITPEGELRLSNVILTVEQAAELATTLAALYPGV